MKMFSKADRFVHAFFSGVFGGLRSASLCTVLKLYSLVGNAPEDDVIEKSDLFSDLHC